MPNRPADDEEGGSKAETVWAGPIRHCAAVSRAASMLFIPEFAIQHLEFIQKIP